MSIETAIRQVLTNDASIAVLVGNHVHPRGIPQGITAAAVVFQQVAGGEELACDGLVGLKEETFQFSAWTAAGDTVARPADARALIMAVRAALFPSGRPYAGTVDDVTIAGTALAGDMRDAIFEPEAEAALRYGKQMDVTFSYS